APPLPLATAESTPPMAPAPGFEPPLIPHEPETDRGEGGEPAEIAAMRAASDAPFPPPMGAQFPPPAGLPQHLAEAEQDASFPPRPFVAAKPKAGPKKSKKLVMLGGALVAMLVLGGGAFVFLRPKAEPAPAPKVAAAPAPVAEVPKVEETPAPVAETPAAVVPETVVPETVKVEEKPAPVVVAAKPVEPPPPPPPPASAEFKAWVENARISGVRAGSTTRVFIDRTSYAVGDLVNPQLGITFDGYSPETRMLTFKDTTGAKVERRN
ncbi:MAG: hypothetical protein PSV13_17215, partial [Lacunisphaera sp.]|nr:hypothetical protein [Lacunisphaera sp.]